MIRRLIFGAGGGALVLLLSCNGCLGRLFSLEPGAHRARAEKLTEKQDFEGAIKEYGLHIEERKKAIAISNSDENPYFYLIYIGDNYLRLNLPDQAMEAYLEALEFKVDLALILDRIRRVAAWYEAQERYQEGMDLLEKHHELDDLLFNADIDRMHKKSLGQADLAP